MRMKSWKKLFAIPTVAAVLFSLPIVQTAGAAEYPSSTSSSDNNISVTKSAEWITEYDGKITISATGVNGFEAMFKNADVLFVLDNSSSMYSSVCMTDEHVSYMPYTSAGEGIVAGKFTESTIATVPAQWANESIVSQSVWDTVLVPAIYDIAKDDLIFGDILKADVQGGSTEAEALDHWGAPVFAGTANIVDLPSTNYYLKMTATTAALQPIGSDPNQWLLYSHTDDLPVTDGGIVGGVLYNPGGTVAVNQVKSTATSITQTVWESLLTGTIQPGFSPDMAVNVPGTQLYLVYTGALNPANTGYAANATAISDPANWTLVDSSYELQKTIPSDTDYDTTHWSNYLDAQWDWLDCLKNYHFEKSGTTLTRVGEVGSSGVFARDWNKTTSYGCETNANLLVKNVESLASKLLEDTGNRVALISFEEAVHASLSWTTNISDVDTFLTTMEQGSLALTTYNTNYEDAWNAADLLLALAASSPNAKHVIFISDGSPTAGNTNSGYLTNLVNQISTDNSAVISAISVGMPLADVNTYLKPIVTDPSLYHNVPISSAIDDTLLTTMKDVYQQIHLWAKNVCISDVIDAHFDLTDKAAFLLQYPNAIITPNADGTQTVFVPVGDLQGSQAATVEIPITLKEPYRDVATTTHFSTNQSLTTEYVDPAGNPTNLNTPTPYLPLPALGELKISKTVEGDGADTSKDFTFQLVLSDTGFNGTMGTFTVTNGVCNFTLKGGQSLTLSGIPVGTTYVITESSYPHWSSAATGASGTISTTLSEAKFTNTYSPFGGIGGSGSGTNGISGDGTVNTGVSSDLNIWSLINLVSLLVLIILFVFVPRKKSKNEGAA